MPVGSHSDDLWHCNITSGICAAPRRRESSMKEYSTRTPTPGSVTYFTVRWSADGMSACGPQRISIWRRGMSAFFRDCVAKLKKVLMDKFRGAAAAMDNCRSNAL